MRTAGHGPLQQRVAKILAALSPIQRHAQPCSATASRDAAAPTMSSMKRTPIEFRMMVFPAIVRCRTINRDPFEKINANAG
jgi:hypothetical protein